MRSWAPLWSTIVDSSVWDEPDHVVKVFLTMMALKDNCHLVHLNAYQIAQRARKSEVEVLDALKILSSPDTRRVEPQEFEGRRIKATEDGWLILNGEKYLKAMQEEKRRANNRRAQAKWREGQKNKLPQNSPQFSERLSEREEYGLGGEGTI